MIPVIHPDSVPGVRIAEGKLIHDYRREGSRIKFLGMCKGDTKAYPQDRDDLFHLFLAWVSEINSSKLRISLQNIYMKNRYLSASSSALRVIPTDHA